MPKKANWGVNEKVVEAKDRKEQAKKAEKEKKSKEEEDGYWAAAGEGSKSKAQARREEQEQKKHEQAQKKAENKKLAEEEAAMIERPKSAKAPKVAVAKVTQHQLQKQKEFEEKVKQQEQTEKKLAAKREVSEDAYSRIVETENKNKEEDVIDARSVEEALKHLGVDDTPGSDKHPEKRMRAAWLAFCERELPILKEDKPGLRQNQYKDMLWKSWQKSPQNPVNAALIQQQAGTSK